MFCEDDPDELHRRLDAITRNNEIEFGDLGDLSYTSRTGDDNVLMTFGYEGRGELTQLFFEILDAAKQFGAQLIIIDTAADTFGGNENVRGQVRQFISAALGRMAQEIDGAVVLCAHPSLTGLRSGEGTGGSTAWSNSVRSRLYLCRPETDNEAVSDYDARILSRRKSNYAGIGDDIRMRWMNGEFTVEGSSAGGGIVASIDRGNAETAAETAFLKCLLSATNQGRPISASRNATNFGPKLFLNFPEANGFRRQDLIWAMERLFAANRIRVEDRGSPSKPARRIVLVEEDF